MHSLAEYIWIDGASPTKKLRSKARVIETGDGDVTLDAFPDWGFDGSSTWQAGGSDSDCTLRPVLFTPDPFRGEGNHLVLCEVLNSDGTPHESNTRARLRAVLDAGAADHDPWFGIEQEYTLFAGRDPFGWPKDGFPAPQGPFYCGVGADEVYGRPMIEAHTRRCIQAGIMIYGINAEVMPCQWEFQIGHRGFANESSDPVNISDHLWMARWLLYRTGEEYKISAKLHPKPVPGDWNGAGAHTNFSTREMRNPETGRAAIDAAIDRLSKKHDEHIAVYGADLDQRLTGLHETCHIGEFKSGVADRGASIRIPRDVAKAGYGYLEDRRPAANMDPYEVCARMLRTVLDIDA